MGIPVRQGRSFAGSDTGGSPPVAMVNETLARIWWAHESGLGDRVAIGRFQGRDFGKPDLREVIGVAGDTKTMSLQTPPRPTIYIPMSQADSFGANGSAWVLRTDGSAGLADELRRTIASIDPSQRVRQLRAMEDIVSSNTATPRFNALLFAMFGCVAVALAAIGVYGLLSFLVSQRTQEVGTRIALGARRADVLKLFLKQGFVLTATGLGLGLGGALWATRWLSSLLFGVRPRDPLSFAAVAVLLLLMGMAATYIPARRAMNVDPIQALRCE